MFEFFVRRLPARRGFLLAAGLDDALDYLETLQFSPAEIDWLKSTGRFRSNLIDYLAGFRFTGDVHAIPEGTVCFPNEPLIRITAPLPMAQLVETRLINILHFQTLIASKAARMVLAAPGKILSDFGLRTAHGAEAGLFSARASYIAGFAGAANVLAGERYGIPIVGTMAHSFVQVHDDEMTAFENFARARPEGVILLIDTYDTEAGARKVVELAPKLKADGIAIRGVRIDSGDLAAMAKKVRGILDAGGLKDVIILVSGGINEDVLQTMMAAKAPIDGFGIGVNLDASIDAPSLDCAYKLQEYAGKPRRKLSEGKVTWPGRKQVWRSLRRRRPHARRHSVAGERHPDGRDADRTCDARRETCCAGADAGANPRTRDARTGAVAGTAAEAGNRLRLSGANFQGAQRAGRANRHQNAGVIVSGRGALRALRATRDRKLE